jgi:outer membrane protein assembly factor BamE (lipoprotein component of BamABCDE complex)
MKSIKLIVLVAVIFLTACAAGVNFVKPADDKLVLGRTTKDQVVALIGQPNGKGQKMSNGQELDIISYAYAKVGETPAFEGVTPARSLAFLFHKNVLVGKEFTSSFKSDSTYFDPQKAKSIRQGMRRSDVVAAVGRPGGEYRYPVIANKSGRALVYIYVQTKGFSSQQSVLTVELDANDVVRKSEFNQSGL